MKRREFIATLGSMMFWPLGASGQTRPLRRIGTFIVGHATSAAATERALREGLEKRGWVEGQTMLLEQRRIRGGYDFLREDALSLVASAPEVIVAGGTDVNAVLKEATQTIP